MAAPSGNNPASAAASDELRLLLDAPAHHLRAALQRVMATSDAAAKDRVLAHLRELATAEPHALLGGGFSAGFAAVGGDSLVGSRKRKAEGDRFVCEQCDGPFYEHSNSKYACNFHDGE